MRKSHYTIITLFSLILIGSVALLLAPLGRSLQTITNDATIRFGIDRRMVVFPNACVTASWQVDNISAVRFNGEGTIGEGEQISCLPQVPTLNLEFINGETAEYTLPIIILVQQPLAWLIIVVELGLLFALITALLGRTLPKDMNLTLRVIRALEISVLWIVIIFVLLEGSTRLWVRFFGTDLERLIYTASVDEIVASRTQFISMPYLNYGLSSQPDDVNALGYRQPDDIVLPKPEGVYRIVALGGSTTHGSTHTTWDEAYPKQLERILREDYGYTQVEVINGGVPGYTTWNSLANLAFRALELDADLVIIYHAINDSFGIVGASPDCYRGNNLNLGLGRGQNIVTSRPNLSRSAFHRYVLIRFGFIPNPAIISEDHNHDVAIDCINSETTLTWQELLATNGTDYIARNLRSMVGIAQAHDINILLSTFAFNGSANEDASANAFFATTQAINERIREVGADMNIPVYDLARDFEPDSAYWSADDFHMLPAGTAAQAQHYAAFIDAQNIINLTAKD